jgi:membrane-associated phospholipid phosphatase
MRLAVRLQNMARYRTFWQRSAVALIAIALLVPNSSVLEHRAVIAVFLFALVTGKGRQFVFDWLPLTAVAALFVLLRQVAAGTPFPRQGAHIAALEAALFGGVTPTTWLQDQLLSADPGSLAYTATVIHASYFFGFVLAGLGIWLVRRQLFGAYVLTLSLTFALGLAGYFALPTEPPWLVARDNGAPAARRVIVETTRGTPVASAVVEAGRAWQVDPDALGDPNPAAAMPSVHTAITAALALFLFRVHPLAGLAGLMYTAAMGLSLVYLGEHFVLDVAAGVACAALAAWFTRSVVGRISFPELPSLARGMRSLSAP